MHRAAVVIMMLALARPTVLLTQVPIDTAVGRLKPGQIVRARTLNGRWIQARLVVVDREPPALHLLDLEAPLEGGLIDSLWVRGSAAKTGAIVGAVATGVPSFLFWTFVCRLVEESSSCHHWGMVAGMTAAGAGSGALIGVLVGAAIRTWPLRYARPVNTAGLTLTRGRDVAVAISMTF